MSQPQPVIVFTRNWGFLLLSIWAIITGIIGLIGHGDVLSVILSIILLLAGVFILVGR